MTPSTLKNSFFSLGADQVLNEVERVLQTNDGSRATGRVLALNSLENRVYEMEWENGLSYVAKFYRPHRWTLDQISEEHAFVYKLKELEIPVVVPLRINGSLNPEKSISKTSTDIHFAVFPKVKGRLRDELSESQLKSLGRYLGRMHGIGATWTLKHRKPINVLTFGREPLHTLRSGPFLKGNFKHHYEQIAEKIIERSEIQFKNCRVQTVHGDCHVGNTLWQDEAPYFLDFDDLTTAPVSQDVWMIIKGRDEVSVRDRLYLLEGYEQMHEFDYASLVLIEPLRALRMIHYAAWISQRWEDPQFPKVFPDFGSDRYWREEIQALDEIYDLMVNATSSS